MSDNLPQADTLQVAAALRTLSSRGFSIHVRGIANLELVSVAKLAELWDIQPAKARAIIHGLPGTVRLDGGDLRARVSDLERYLESHPATMRIDKAA